MRELMVKALLFTLCLVFAVTMSAPSFSWTDAGDMAMTAGMLLAVCSTAAAGWLRSPGHSMPSFLDGRFRADRSTGPSASPSDVPSDGMGTGAGAASGVDWAPPVVYAALAVVEPRWCAFLPLVAYDLARAFPSTVGTVPTGFVARTIARLEGRPVIRFAVRFAWVVPFLRCAVPYVLNGDGRTAVAAPSFLLTIALCAGLGSALGRSDGDAAASRRTLRAERDRARESARGARTRIADLDEERSRAVRIATLGERTRIAREIHDNVGHLLTRAIMQAKAGGVVADATGDTVAARGFAELGGTLDDAMTMVRRSVHDLEDDGTDFAAQIDAAAHAFDGASPGFVVTLTRDVASAPAPVARCLATVIRESLSNVVRHSAARSATVTLRDFPAIWQLVVLDPGPGLDDDAEPARPDGEAARGMGLADIAERVRAIGGTSACGPYGDGWRVFVAVPKGPWTMRNGDA